MVGTTVKEDRSNLNVFIYVYLSIRRPPRDGWRQTVPAPRFGANSPHRQSTCRWWTPMTQVEYIYSLQVIQFPLRAKAPLAMLHHQTSSASSLIQVHQLTLPRPFSLSFFTTTSVPNTSPLGSGGIFPLYTLPCYSF